MFLNELLDKERLDGGSRITTAGLYDGRDIRFHRIHVTCCLFLLGHRHFLWTPQRYCFQLPATIEMFFICSRTVERVENFGDLDAAASQARTCAASPPFDLMPSTLREGPDEGHSGSVM
ncbi:hypothetical protein AAII07_58580 [Microvirga sp. 0TCS3.31]